MTAKQHKTFLVIPHYNDCDRLAVFLPDLLKCLPDFFTILISDDGSCLAERKKLVDLIDSIRHSGNNIGPKFENPIFVEKNTGKGGAVLRGWAHSSGYDYIGFVDADGAIAASEIMRAWRFLLSDEGSSCDALFASRVKMLGRKINRSLIRHLSGRIFATIVSVLGKVPAYDTQCGFKLLRADTLNKILPFMKTQGFTFDVELCLILTKFGLQIHEFPIDWQDILGSKVRIVPDGLKMACEVVRIKTRINSLIP